MALDAWLTLLHAARPGERPWLAALKTAGSAEALLAASARTLAGAGLPSAAIERLKAPAEDSIERARAWLAAAPQRRLIGFGTAEYPPLLASIADAPLALWVEGARPDLLVDPQLAMVGSRNPTAGGRETAERFAHYFSERGITITSGLATGIDGASHRGALQGAAGTIAVLGGGIDVLFPRSHAALAAAIAKHGVLVSEYLPGTEPQRFHFPQRNRIIAGLALGTLVVEATRRSGSLITAEFANDFGREVFAVPGSIHNPLARGCHALIRQGAKLVEEASDVLLELAPQLPAALLAKAQPVESGAAPAVEQPDPAYRKLMDALEFAPLPIGTIAARAELTAAEVSSMLLMLELQGFVEALPGGRYSRLAKRN